MEPTPTSNPASDEMLRIQRQIQDLVDANGALTRRVFALETTIAKLTSAELQGTPEPAPARPAAPPPLPTIAESTPAPALPAAPAPEPPGIESSFGLKWINRIGAMTVMLGVAFFFKYAVDNEWVGPAGRVILGILAGLAAIFAGDRLWRKDQKTFAQGIQALGSVILYLSFFAAFGFYSLIPQAAAFVLMFATTAMTGALSLRYQAPAALALGLLGGWATPLLLSKGEPNDLFFLGYMLLLNGGAMYVATLRSWTHVEALASAGAWVFLSAWCGARAEKAGRWLGVAFIALNYAIAAVMGSRAWLAYIAQLGAAIALGVCYQGTWEAFQVLDLGLLVAGLAVARWKRLPAGGLMAVMAYWFARAIADSPQPRLHVTEALLCGCIAFATALAWGVLQAWAARLGKPDLLAAGIGGIAFYVASYDLLEGEYKAYLGLFTVAVAAAYLLYGYWISRATPANQRDSTGPLMAAGLALGFLALAVPVQLAGFRITIAWAFQAAAVAWIAHRLKDGRVLAGAAILVMLAVLRLVGEDASSYWPPVEGGYVLLLNPRFLSFLSVFGSLLFLAWTITKFEGISRGFAGALYLLAHFLMILGLHLELFAYVDSRPDLASRGSIKTLISSVILAGYGIQFIASGFARKSAFPRLLGLGLFGIVIVKLYIYDVWLLDMTYRMAAFILLGAMLLAGSYLYSRYRDKLSTLIRDE